MQQSLIELARRAESTGQQLLDILQTSFESTVYDTKSVVAGLILSLGGSLALFIVFCLLRPRHNLIYAPKIRYSEDTKKPEPLSRNFLYWFWQVFVIPEETLIQKLGIDAAVFIRFMTMLRNLFVVDAVLGCCIAIPINIIYNKKSANSQATDSLGVFGLMTPISLTGLPLAAHIALGYVFNIILFTFLFINYKKVMDIRRKAFMTKEYQNALFMRTLMLTEIPRKLLSEDALVALMGRQRVSRAVKQVTVGKNVKELTKLLEEHEQIVLKLEQVLAKYLKNPDKLPSKRPQCRPVKEDRSVLPKRVDAIDYYIKRSQRLEKQINVARDSIDTKNALPYGLVSYANPDDCHTVASSIGHRRKGGIKFELAPRPSDLIWSNMVLTKLERKSKDIWGTFLYIMILIAWIVPNAFIGCFLTNLTRIGQLFPKFEAFLNSEPILSYVLQGFLAPVITTCVFMILPVIMRRLSRFQGKLTKTEREHDVTFKLFCFFFFNNFFIVTLMSVIWNIGTMVYNLIHHQESDVHSVDDAFREVATKLASAIIRASSFWIMYILRANLGAVLDLLQVISLFWGTFQRYVLSPTPRELMLATAPQPFQYATYYNWLLFYSAIALAFTTLQPLILPVLAFYLCLDTVIKKYNLMYMTVTKYESDGRYWPLLHNCMLFSAFMGNLILIVVVWNQGSWIMGVATCPLPALVIIFKIVTAIMFNKRFNYFVPTPHERQIIEQVTAMSSGWEARSKLEERYLNPAISRRLPVPLVHAKAQFRLREVCRMDEDVDGNDEFEYESNPFLPGSKPYRSAAGAASRDQLGIKSEFDSSGTPLAAKRRSQINGNKFDIVQESELDYEHLQEIEYGGQQHAGDQDYTPSMEMSNFEAKNHYVPSPIPNPYEQSHQALTPPPANPYYENNMYRTDSYESYANAGIIAAEPFENEHQELIHNGSPAPLVSPPATQHRAPPGGQTPPFYQQNEDQNYFQQNTGYRRF